eukprot:SAG31_NODE_23833_length_494_cov_1.569620_1_plen_87_part_10
MTSEACPDPFGATNAAFGEIDVQPVGDSQWCKCVPAVGPHLTYYFNVETEQRQWDRPNELLGVPDSSGARPVSEDQALVVTCPPGVQ